MKSIVSLLAVGVLLAINGAVAAPVPEANNVSIITLYRTKVYAVTSTTWVEPTYTPEPETKTSQDNESTTTTSETETSSTTSSEAISETLTTETPTTTTSSTTEVTETPTPTPTPTTEETTTTSPPTVEPPTVTTPELKPTVTIPPQEDQPQEEEPPKEQPSGGPKFSGEATYYDPGLGSCGLTSTSSDFIAAISYIVMDPQNPGNPNNNPLCGKKIRCTRDGKNPTVIIVVDRCPVCKAGDVDLSPAAYAALGGTIEEGRFEVECEWL